MKASRFSDAQKAFISKQGEEGTSVAEICRKAGIRITRGSLLADHSAIACRAMDGTIVQVHQKATGTNAGRTLSPSGAHGGMTIRIVALADAPWQSCGFLLLPGQSHDMKSVALPIKGIPFGAPRADTAFDAGWLLQDIEARGAAAATPPKPA